MGHRGVHGCLHLNCLQCRRQQGDRSILFDFKLWLRTYLSLDKMKQESQVKDLKGSTEGSGQGNQQSTNKRTIKITKQEHATIPQERVHMTNWMFEIKQKNASNNPSPPEQSLWNLNMEVVTWMQNRPTPHISLGLHFWCIWVRSWNDELRQRQRRSQILKVQKGYDLMHEVSVASSGEGTWQCPTVEMTQQG